MEMFLAFGAFYSESFELSERFYETDGTCWLGVMTKSTPESASQLDLIELRARREEEDLMVLDEVPNSHLSC